MKDYKAQIADYYANAKFLVQQNKPDDARAYVLAFVNSAREIYHSQTGIVSKAQTRGFLLHWVAIAAILRENGVTDEVLDAFSLLTERTQQPKVNPAASKSGTKPEQQQSQKPLAPPKNGDVDLDGLVGNSGGSQGWCADLFEKYKASVVSIRVSSSDSAASGTGFIISDNGFLLTNDHVVYDVQNGGYYPKITMSFADGKKAYELDVIASDKRWDVALCAFKAAEVPAFAPIPRIKDYMRLKQGADILVIGNGFSMGLAPFTGTVKFTRDVSGNLVYTAPSNPGDSGGPVCNRIGECIGINKSIIKTVAIGGGKPVDANGMTNATPMDEIDKLLGKWTAAHNITI
ncbi:MAG: serine protease [Clostridiales bacterium]|jgi:hypothetical protein|nr:serine protease [Clostridiales bacterium]